MFTEEFRTCASLFNWIIDIFKLMQLFQLGEKHEKKISLGRGRGFFENKLYYTTEYCDGSRVQIIKYIKLERSLKGSQT